MLPMKYIPQLIGHTFSIAYLDIYIVVGVAIYPVIDAAVLNVVFQFNRESSVSLASHNEYTVTKDDADSLHHKAERFIAETGCKKSVSLTMVTVSGIAHPLFGVF